MLFWISRAWIADEPGRRCTTIPSYSPCATRVSLVTLALLGSDHRHVCI
jgi:hypothetical protein